MKKSFFSLVSFGFLAAFSLVASAVESGLYVNVGTLGVGGGVAVGITDNLGVRAGYSAYTIDKDFDSGGIDYSGELKLGAAELLLDWHPFSNGFRLTAGAMKNRNQVSGTGKPMSGTFEFNGNTYQAQDIGDLKGDIKFDSFAPYLGLGYGKAAGRDGRLHFQFDVGVMFSGSPDVKLTAHCGAGMNQTDCDQLQSDLLAEQKDLQEDADKLKHWPVARFGLAYRF